VDAVLPAATEHARAAIRRGGIGKVETLTSRFPDRCYPVQAAPMVFGTRSCPAAAAAGNTAGGGAGGNATLVYGCAGGSADGSADGAAGTASSGGGVAMVSMPAFSESQFDERFVVRGGRGEVVLEAAAHCPTKVTVNGETTEYPQCNQHGFFYEVEAIHRVLANGLRECPQYTREESLAVTSVNQRP
jgi:hypothetical protein